jgi:hypothetical protein
MEANATTWLQFTENMPLNTALLLMLTSMAAFVVGVEICWMMYLATRTWAMYCAGRKAQKEAQNPHPVVAEPPSPREPVYPTGAITARDVLGEEEWTKLCKRRVDALDKTVKTCAEQTGKECEEKK